jgi:DNA replication protein DnaC
LEELLVPVVFLWPLFPQIDCLKSHKRDEAMILLDLLEERYQKGMQIITSQVDIEGWQSLFADKVASEAIVDRLKNPSEKVVLTGPSYRGRIKS